MAQPKTAPPPDPKELATLLEELDHLSTALANEQTLLDETWARAKAGLREMTQSQQLTADCAGRYQRLLQTELQPALLKELSKTANQARESLKELEQNVNHPVFDEGTANRVKNAHAVFFESIRIAPARPLPTVGLEKSECMQLLQSARRAAEQAAKRDFTQTGYALAPALSPFQLPLLRYLRLLRLPDAAFEQPLSAKLSPKDRLALCLRTAGGLPDPDEWIGGFSAWLDKPNPFHVDPYWRLGRVKVGWNDWNAASASFEKGYQKAAQGADKRLTAYMAIEWAYALAQNKNSDAIVRFRLLRQHKMHYPLSGYLYPTLSQAEVLDLGK